MKQCKQSAVDAAVREIARDREAFAEGRREALKRIGKGQSSYHSRRYKSGMCGSISPPPPSPAVICLSVPSTPHLCGNPLEATINGARVLIQERDPCVTLSNEANDEVGLCQQTHAWERLEILRLRSRWFYSSRFSAELEDALEIALRAAGGVHKRLLELGRSCEDLGKTSVHLSVAAKEAPAQVILLKNKNHLNSSTKFFIPKSCYPLTLFTLNYRCPSHLLSTPSSPIRQAISVDRLLFPCPLKFVPKPWMRTFFRLAQTTDCLAHLSYGIILNILNIRVYQYLYYVAGWGVVRPPPTTRVVYMKRNSNFHVSVRIMSSQLLINSRHHEFIYCCRNFISCQNPWENIPQKVIVIYFAALPNAKWFPIVCGRCFFGDGGARYLGVIYPARRTSPH